MDGNSILFIIWFISLGIALLVGNIGGGWAEAMFIGVGGFVVGLIAGNIYEAIEDQKLAAQRQYNKEHAYEIARERFLRKDWYTENFYRKPDLFVRGYSSHPRYTYIDYDISDSIERDIKYLHKHLSRAEEQELIIYLHRGNDDYVLKYLDNYAKSCGVSFTEDEKNRLKNILSVSNESRYQSLIKEIKKAKEEEDASSRRKLSQTKKTHIKSEQEEYTDFAKEYSDETFSPSTPARPVVSRVETYSKPKTKGIAEVIARRKVTELVHFTRIENVKSIMSNGFVARDKLSSAPYHAIVNDAERLDGNLDATSFSVSFPNWRYFFLKICENKNAKWAVISVKPAVLLDDKLKSIFFDTNAASSSAHECTFEEMFGASRDNYPEDAQAEIQIFGTVLPKYIRAVYVKDNADKAYLARLGIQSSVQSQYFYKREKDK